jgi:hypothetical protein
MLSGDDVLDVMAQLGGFLRKLTIFAAVVGALADLLLGRGVH